MGAPVRFQKAVPRTKEKRRGEAPIGAPARVMGRLFPSAEGTGVAVRRATGCGVPHQRLSALRPPRMGGKSPKAAGRTLPRNDGAWLTHDEHQTAAPVPHLPSPDNADAAASILAKRTRGLRAESVENGLAKRTRDASAPSAPIPEAVSKKPQPHRRIGSNPVDGLTLTIAGAKRSQRRRIRETGSNAQCCTSALPRTCGLRRRQCQAGARGRARDDRFGPLAARPRRAGVRQGRCRTGGRKAASPARRSTPCAG